MGWKLFCALLSILLVLAITQEGSATCNCPNNGCFQSPSTGACEVTATSRQYYTSYYYVTEYYTQYYYTSCGVFGWGRCRRSRQRSRQVQRQRTSSRTTYYCNFQCCSGYHQSGRTCTPVCNPSCANGGTCVSPNGCACTPGWAGSSCSQAVCNPACANGGTCSSPDTCSCASGWTGPTCNQPVCSPDCQNGGLCTAPSTCDCRPAIGYTGSRCDQDHNECNDNPQPCHQVCVNNVGSFTCECETGFLLRTDGINCYDINECEPTSPCDQRCVNTEGSYRCECHNGFEMQNGNCVDIEECIRYMPCDHICHNQPGSFVCECNTGYELQGTGTCIDIDECVTIQPCSQICHNNPGSYTCSCNDGYSLMGSAECIDIDECEEGTHSCQDNCQNTIGSYTCYCNQGRILSANLRDCEEFNLPSVTIPPVAVNGNFINAIRGTLNTCSNGGLCACMNTIFTELENLGIGQMLVTTEEDFICLNFAAANIPVSDIILALFGTDAQSVALPFPANLDKLSYNCTSQEVHAETAQTGGMLDLFRGLLSVSTLTLKVTVTSILQSPEMTYLEVSGYWTIGEKQFYVWVEMTTSQWNFEAQLVLEEDVDLIQFLASAVGQDIQNGPFGNVIFLTDIRIKGIYDTDNLIIAIVLQGTIRIQDWFEQTVCIFLHHELVNVGRRSAEIAIISDCENAGLNLQLGGLVQDVTGFDISGIPFLADLMLPNFHLIYNTENFPFDDVELLGFELPELSMAFDYTGFKVVFEFAIEGLVEVQWIFRFESGRVVFEPLEPGTGFKIGDVLRAIASALTPPNVDLFDLDLFGIRVVEMNLNFEMRTLHLSIAIPQTLTIFLDDFQVQNIFIDFEVMYQASLELTHFNITGELIIAGSLFSVQITFADDVYNLQACAEDARFSVGGLISAFQSSDQPPALIQSSGLANFGLYRPCLFLEFRANQFPDNMCFSADILRSDFGALSVAVCVSQSRQWLYAFEIRQLVLAKMLAPVVGDGVRRIAILNQKLDAAVVVAPTAVSMLPLRGSLVSDLESVVPGVTIVVRASWPDTCSSDAFCTIARDLLGENAMLFLKVELLSSGAMTIEAGVMDFKLGSLTLSSASLQIRVSPTTFSLGIEASLDLQTPPVTLTGALRLKLPSLSVALEMSLSGCWNNAFGISILDICDLYLAVTLTPGVPVPGIAFGGRVRVGLEQCYQLEAAGYIGLGSPVPEDNFFYAEMGPLTLQRVLDMFCVSFTLPSFLGDTGYPEGFQVSFALADITISSISLFIPRGFYYRGTLNIFGFRVFAEMLLDPPRLIDITCRLSPLRLAGGLLAMYESRAVTSRGPFLEVYIATPIVRANASGYVNLFGIEAEGILVVSNTGFEVSVYGNLFGVLEAELTAYASIGNLLDSEFRVSGRLRISILKAIEDAVVGVIRAAAEGAERAISGAQEKLREAEVVFDKAVEVLRAAEGEVRAARSKVTDARNKLDGLRRSLDALCKFRSCPNVCIPFLCPCGCAARVFGACVLPCIKWDSCCFKLPDPLCVLYNIGCAILRAPVELLILAAKAILLVVEAVLYAAELLLRGLQVIVDKARVVVDILIAVLEAIKFTVRIGLKALEAVVSFLLTGIIDIREIGFDLAIGLFRHGSISAYMDVSFFRQSPIRLQITLPIFNPLALVGDLVERAVPGLGRKKRDFGGKANKVLWLAEHFKTKGHILPVY